MPDTRKSRAEIPTIDCALVTITTADGDEFGFDTSNQISVEPQTEEQAAVRLVVKGILRAQKRKNLTIVGNTITLTDNVFNPDLVLAIQGGTCTFDAQGNLTSYTPPAVDSPETLEPFTLNAYSAQYDTSGDIINYEKISYPNCKGDPIAFSSEDDTFRAPEYTIESAPAKGQPPYTITYVDELPELYGPDFFTVTQTLSNVTSTFNGTKVYKNAPFTATLTATEGTLGTITVTMGGEDISSTAVSGNVVTIAKVTGAIVITASAS